MIISLVLLAVLCAGCFANQDLVEIQIETPKALYFITEESVDVLLAYKNKQIELFDYYPGDLSKQEGEKEAWQWCNEQEEVLPYYQAVINSPTYVDDEIIIETLFAKINSLKGERIDLGEGFKPSEGMVCSIQLVDDPEGRFIDEARLDGRYLIVREDKTIIVQMVDEDGELYLVQAEKDDELCDIFEKIGVEYGYTGDQGTEEPLIEYESEVLGFTLSFPMSLEGTYEVVERDNGIDVFCNSIHEKYEHSGMLFSIDRRIGELITDEDLKQLSVPQQIMLKGNGYTYILRIPSDVQYIPDDETLTEEYQRMVQDVNGIAESITLLGNQEPLAKNEGYKLVGSSFFTIEIPREWDLEPYDTTLQWSIREDTKKIGYISLESYYYDWIVPEGFLRNLTVLRDEETQRAVIILIDKKKDLGILEIIKDSFEFQNGPYNTVDMKTAADTYVAQGGQMVYGFIDGFEMTDGSLSAIRINAVDFIEGDPDDPETPEGSFPNGFELESIGPVTYPVGERGVDVKPLIGPNYNTFAIYHMTMVDEDFIHDFEEKYDRFYQIYVGADGEIKILIMFSLP